MWREGNEEGREEIGACEMGLNSSNHLAHVGLNEQMKRCSARKNLTFVK